MIQELVWTYGCNIVVNSAMAFFTTSMIVVGAITLFRIRQPRLQLLMLSIPFLKLFLDIFSYDFSSWALRYSINPLAAEPGTRMLSVWLGYPPTTGIQMLTSEGKTFTVADLLSLSVNFTYVKVAVTCVALISAFLLLRWISSLLSAFADYRALIDASVPCRRPVYNPKLNFRLLKSRVSIVQTDAITIPCALGISKKVIAFPKALVEELSQTEYEAVVAHELDHLRWHDALIRTTFSLLSTLFWWVPTSWCLRRIERLQEMACDRAVQRIEVPSVDLASAICKTIAFAKVTDAPLLRTCFIGKRWMTKRMEEILTMPSNRYSRFVNGVHFTIAAFLCTMILFGKFWIF